ncbi:EamA family transporter RarD [Gammaproteobacteria bacterium AS21]|jgi:chloramphenicol-sensitive protein RarD
MSTNDSEFKQGICYALTAYVLWSIAPLYFKLIEQVAPGEILMHRIIWSFVLLLILIFATGQVKEVIGYLKRPKLLLLFAITACLVAANWLVFIWAVHNDKLLEASLGYFINPMVNVALGVVFLRERIPRLQLFAVAVATFGVLFQLVVFGYIPLVSLALAITFAIYGLLKKKIKVKAVTGLFIETTILLPAALYYWWFIESDTSSFANNPMSLNITLICAGIVTTLPLLAFSAGATRIPYYMIGLLQYIGPSAMFVLAIVVFDEVLDQTKLITFAFIWLALFIFVYDILVKLRKSKVSL